jgi:hypothetical protein
MNADTALFQQQLASAVLRMIEDRILNIGIDMLLSKRCHPSADQEAPVDREIVAEHPRCHSTWVEDGFGNGRGS